MDGYVKNEVVISYLRDNGVPARKIATELDMSLSYVKKCIEKIDFDKSGLEKEKGSFFGEKTYSEAEVLEMMRIARRNEDWTVNELFEQFKKK